MRLSESEIIKGMMHENVTVREEAVRFFTRTHRVQPDITRKVIEAIDHFGWESAWRWTYQVRDFELDESLMAWAMEQIHRSDNDGPDESLQMHLAHMISAAPIEVLRSNAAQILADDFFHRQLSARAHVPTTANMIEQRLAIHEQSAEACWNALLAHCETLTSVDQFAEANIPKCETWIERIVEDREFCHSRQHDIRELLAGDSLPNDPSEWRIGLMIMLAGQLRLPDTIPLLYRHYEADWDWYNEEITSSLSRIGTEDVHHYIADRYSGEPWYVRNYVHAVFENVYSDSVIPLLSELLNQERDDDIRSQLGVAAASHFDDTCIEIARSVFNEAPEDPERQTIIERLVAHSHLADFDLPERDQWERRINQEWSGFVRRRKVLDRFETIKTQPAQMPANSVKAISATPVRIDSSHTKVRRNGECPCGSGKKYKKCCLRKSTI